MVLKKALLEPRDSSRISWLRFLLISLERGL